MRRRLLLLLPIPLLTNIKASAQQRSFDDALYIARQQAAKLGVVMDQQAIWSLQHRRLDLATLFVQLCASIDVCRHRH